MQEQSAQHSVAQQAILSAPVLPCYVLVASRTHQLPIRLWVLPSAEVAQSPRRVSDHRQLVVLVEKREQRPESTRLEDKVSRFWRVSCNVSERPDCLLAHVGDGAAQQLDEDGDSPGVYDDLGVVRGARGDVCKCPCCLELGASK